tara:strand:+ start:1254 stop:1514 length:261 start_codon:yes stop_codon:yes gene_type:complete
MVVLRLNGPPKGAGWFLPLRALGYLGLFPLSAALADVLTINAAPSVEGDGLQHWIGTSLSRTVFVVVELDDTSSKGLGKSVLISCE